MFSNYAVLLLYVVTAGSLIFLMMMSLVAWLWNKELIFDVCCVTAKLVPLAYGIKKLQISCVVEDDKVSTDDLEEQIVAFEDYVSFSFLFHVMLLRMMKLFLLCCWQL